MMKFLNLDAIVNIVLHHNFTAVIRFRIRPDPYEVMDLVLVTDPPDPYQVMDLVSLRIRPDPYQEMDPVSDFRRVSQG